MGLALVPSSIQLDAAPPRVTSQRYALELIAREPAIVTPVGMTFDHVGRLLVIESHTHQPPENYEGPKHDRILMFSDSDGDAKLDRWSTFAEGFRHSMNLLARADGAVYLVTRGSVVLLRDTDNDGAADNQDVILRLETKDDYPHNALGGIDQETDGSLIIGYGENHGEPYRLIGADGKVTEGTGGLDGFYRMSADGKGIQHFARGVWNPFSLCVVPDGRIFAVDNDPDASPPCRLLHVVPGGDYGYLYQYGRAGTHPLQAWNGELPGTLPMVCGTGEAPTAIVDHAGSLWVTSWGDHRIERYQLVARGASYGATREVVVQGDADFRPAGMAVAPDGSLYFGDWVLRDYPVHGRGRIWRLTLPASEIKTPFPPRSEEDKRAATLSGDNCLEAINSDDPYLRAAGIWQLAQPRTIDFPTPSNSRERLGCLEARRINSELWSGPKSVEAASTELMLRHAISDNSPDIRLFALRWVCDRQFVSLRDDVAKLLDNPPPSQRYYLAVLAAIDWLDNKPEMRPKEIADHLLVRELKRDDRSAEAQALALSLLSPDNKFLTPERLRGYLQSESPALRLEAARSLVQQSNAERFNLLASVARDKTQNGATRLEAIMGLAAAADMLQELLQAISADSDLAAKREANRVLRLAGLRPAASEVKPSADDLPAWNERLAESGDAAAGRRLFFSEVGPRCGVCHQHSGRGGRIGPDLTRIADSMTRERIVESILQPDQEVAPHYQPYLLITDDGKTHTGLRMPEGGDDGTEEYIDSAGRHFRLPSNTIEVREATSTSIMPSGLESVVSIEDLRDLVAFLTTAESAQ
jgi:putative membrane-bound dehydrogenase-like protein